MIPARSNCMGRIVLLRRRRRFCSRVFQKYHFWNEFITHIIKLLIAFVNCNLAHITDTVDVFFGYGQMTHTGNEVDNARSNTVWRVFRYQVLFLNHNSNKLAYFGEFVIDGKPATISLDECFRLRFTEVRFLGII